MKRSIVFVFPLALSFLGGCQPDNNTKEWRDAFTKYNHAVFHEKLPMTCQEDKTQEGKQLLRVTWKDINTSFDGCRLSISGPELWGEEAIRQGVTPPDRDAGGSSSAKESLLVLGENPPRDLAYYISCDLPEGFPNPVDARSPDLVMNLVKDPATGSLTCENTEKKRLLPATDPRYEAVRGGEPGRNVFTDSK